MFHTENPQIVDNTVKDLVAMQLGTQDSCPLLTSDSKQGDFHRISNR